MNESRELIKCQQSLGTLLIWWMSLYVSQGVVAKATPGHNNLIIVLPIPQKLDFPGVSSTLNLYSIIVKLFLTCSNTLNW